MTPKHQFFGGVSTAALTLFAAPAAWADVTADDVWANLTDYAAAFGGELTAQTDRTGDTLTINDIVVQFNFPNNSGLAQFGLSGLALIENADGTVSILYAADPTLSFDTDVTDKGNGGASLILRPGTYAVTASGQPGDITYHSTYENVVLDLASIRSTEVPELSGQNSTFELVFDGWTGTSRVTEGALLSVTGDLQVQPFRFDMSMAADRYSTEQHKTGGAMSASYSFALPSGGSDLMNLRAAFDQGMFFEASSQSDGTQSIAKTELEGEFQRNQSSAQGATTATVRVDGTALSLSAKSEAIEMSYFDSALPFAIAADVAAFGAEFLIPLAATADPQPFAYKADLTDLRVGPGIWAAFDPTKALPRDPADLSVDITGEMILDVDLLNVDSIKIANFRETSPVLPTRIDVTTLSLSALGVLAQATGALTFDQTDLTTFDGLPRPQGQADFTVTGLNGLLDLMISSGILTESNAMAARGGMMMFTETIGADQIRSDLIIDAQGGITANGQPIK